MNRVNKQASNLRLGVDLGGTKIEAAILDAEGALIARLRCHTPRGPVGKIAEAMLTLVRQVETAANVKAPLPLGIATPGSISPKTGLMRNCNSTSLNGHNLVYILEQMGGRPVRLANDADCFTLSESTDGAGADADSVFGVIIGTGVGGGLALGKQRFNGCNGIVGEWGHNRLPLERAAPLPEPCAQPRLCYCGRLDCIETYLSGPGIALTHAQLHDTDIDLKQLGADSPDAAHSTTLAIYTDLFAAALAAVVNVIDPDVIVLGGGLSNVRCLYDTVPPLLSAGIFSDVCATRLLPARYGDSSGVRGAAWLW